MSQRPRLPRCWVPHRVDGRSVWEHADALNARELFDGRLRVPVVGPPPTTRGGAVGKPKSEPRFDLAGLLRLADAKQKFPHETEQALHELQAASERFRVASADAHSPWHRVRTAIVLPALGSRDEACYFYDPAERKIIVVNWGAAKPPAMYAYETDDESSSDGPSTTPADAKSPAPAATPAHTDDPSAPPPPTAEELAELEAMAADLAEDLKETREAIDVIDALIGPP